VPTLGSPLEQQPRISAAPAGALACVITAVGGEDQQTWVILCETADIATQCASIAASIALPIETRVLREQALFDAARHSLEAHTPTAAILIHEPALEQLIELAHSARGRDARVALALVGWTAQRRVLIEVAGELGLCAVNELRPLFAALQLWHVGIDNALTIEGSGLAALDRARLNDVLVPQAEARGQLISLDTGGIAYRAGTRVTNSAATAHAAHSQTSVALGEAPSVREALLALSCMERLTTEVESVVDVDARAVLDVIFGPRRALSDPASKSALAPYGIPLPVEELCSSASRAAAEASRIGYPVCISLASPDLRVWDHPDLRVDMVDNAARVRETFRQLFAVAQARLATDPAKAANAERRLLGVLVTATSEATALLSVYATALPHGRVAVRVGFADPHGHAAHDETVTVLPAEQHVIERALSRLAAASLLFEADSALPNRCVDHIVDVLQRVAAFVHDRRLVIESVELRPLAVLVDGSVEVREACVTVSDWFEKNS